MLDAIALLAFVTEEGTPLLAATEVWEKLVEGACDQRAAPTDELLFILVVHGSFINVLAASVEDILSNLRVLEMGTTGRAEEERDVSKDC